MREQVIVKGQKNPGRSEELLSGILCFSHQACKSNPFDSSFAVDLTMEPNSEAKELSSCRERRDSRSCLESLSTRLTGVTVDHNVIPFT